MKPIELVHRETTQSPYSKAYIHVYMMMYDVKNRVYDLITVYQQPDNTLWVAGAGAYRRLLETYFNKHPPRKVCGFSLEAFLGLNCHVLVHLHHRLTFCQIKRYRLTLI